MAPFVLPALPHVVASSGLRLLASRVERTVLGPIVRTSLWLTYENATSERTNASLHFDLPEATAPSGFAFVQNGRYVAGRITERDAAWRDVLRRKSTSSPSGLLAYTGSLVDEDEGVEATLPSVAPGARLRVRLYTIGFVGPAREGLHRANVEAGSVRTAVPMPENEAAPVFAVSQRFGKERFVMGLIRSPDPLPPAVEVVKGLYGDGTSDLDVTARVRSAFAQGARHVWARDADLGDPRPGVGKTLRLTLDTHGVETVDVTEQGYRRFFGVEDRDALPSIEGLAQTQTVRLDGRTFAFFGRWNGAPLIATIGGFRAAFRPAPIPDGADAARLWAYQMINREGEAPMQAYGVRTIVDFVKKYGVPCLDASSLAADSSAGRRS